MTSIFLVVGENEHEGGSAIIGFNSEERADKAAAELTAWAAKEPEYPSGLVEGRVHLMGLWKAWHASNPYYDYCCKYEVFIVENITIGDSDG